MSQETSLLETMTGLFFAQTDILPVGDITIYESQLLGAYDSPTVAVSIRNPGYRPTYSYGLVKPRKMTNFFENEKNIFEKLKKGKMLRFIYVTVKSDNCKSGRNAGGQK